MKNIKRITILYLILILLIIALANQGEYIHILRSLVGSIPYGDKLGHFILMGFLSFFVNLSLNCQKIKVFQLSVLKGSVIVLLIVTFEEFSQIFIDNRSYDLLDLTFDYLGIWVFGQLALKWMNYQQRLSKKHQS
jgi:polysaccharide biosynthesis protein VpsQ